MYNAYGEFVSLAGWVVTWLVCLLVSQVVTLSYLVT